MGMAFKPQDVIIVQIESCIYFIAIARRAIIISARHSFIRVVFPFLLICISWLLNLIIDPPLPPSAYWQELNPRTGRARPQAPQLSPTGEPPSEVRKTEMETRIIQKSSRVMQTEEDRQSDEGQRSFTFTMQSHTGEQHTPKLREIKV